MKWPMVKLADVCQVNPRLPKEYDETQDVSFLAMASVSEDGILLNQETRVLSETKKGFTYFERGDVIVAKITPCFENGKAAYLDSLQTQVGFGSTEFHVLRPDIKQLDGKYLFYLIWNRKFRFIAERIMSGSAGQKRVPASFLQNFEIPLPPLAEQKRIAAILDKADAIRQKRQQAIALADDFLRSVFLDMFGDPVTNPLGWKTGSLIDFGDFKNGLNYTSSEVGEEVFCIGVGDFKSLGRIEGVSSLSKINLSSLPNNDYFVDEGDILFVRSNGNKELVGRNVIVYPEGSKVTFSGFCIRYRINDKDSLSNLYLSHCLKIPSMRKLLLSGGQGANIQNISQKTLSELTIPIPSIDMQNTYNEIVNGHQLLIKKSNYDFLKSYELFNSISKKAFSGQL